MTFVYENPNFSSVKRSILSWPIATVVTSGLFLIMQSLLPHGDVHITNHEPHRFIDVFDLPLKVIPHLHERIIKPEAAEPAPDQLQTTPVNIKLEKSSMNIGPILQSQTEDFDPSANLGLADKDYLPLTHVLPMYPRRAFQRGIEGYAIVEFIVAPDGSVPSDSIVVIETNPKGYFESASINAAQKFKFKPRVVNDVAQAVSGVRYCFNFNIIKIRGTKNTVEPNTCKYFLGLQ